MNIIFQVGLCNTMVFCLRPISGNGRNFSRGLLLAFLLLASSSSWCSTPARQVRVLMLYHGERDSLALERFQVGVRRTMEQELDVPVTIYTESFDEEGLGQSPSFVVAMEQLLLRKYSHRGIDIVVPIGEYPIQFVQTRLGTLFPRAKLLYLSIGSTPQQPIPGATGMVMPVNAGPTVALALSQNPEVRHVLLIAGSTGVDRGTAQLALVNAQELLEKKNKRADLRVLAPGTLSESLKTVAALPPDAISVFVCYYGDSTGETFSPARILPRFSVNTNRPIYGWFDTEMGRGIVGGSLIDLEANGALFGNLVVRVVRGADPGTIPEITGDISINEFDWAQLRRWGISMDKVPAGSTVINREFSVWELYKWRIIGLIGLMILEAVLIATLIRLTMTLRRQARNLAYRQKVEALIAHCAAAFINLPAELVNNEIEILFQEVLEFFDLDRINLFEFSAGTGKLRLLCTRFTTSSSLPSQSIDLRQFPWNVVQMQQGTPILIAGPDDLPPDAAPLVDYLKNNGIRSFAAFPLMRGKKPFGAMSFSTVRTTQSWQPDLVVSLSTIVDIFSSALDRKNAEESASGSRDRLTGIVESAMDAIIAIDEQQRIVVFNATAEKMFGCTADDALGGRLERFIPAHLRAHHREVVASFAKSGETNRSMGGLGPLIALRASGQEFPIEASISQIKVSGEKLFTVIIRDVTEREQAEHNLRESNELNLSILQSLRGHLAVLDSEGKIAAATTRGPEFVAINGINSRDLRVGDDYLAMCKAVAKRGDPDVAAALEGIRDVYDGKIKDFEMEYGYESGFDVRWYQMSVTPLGASGNGVVISHDDITLRKRHEQAIRELSGRLINAQEQERSRIARELHDDINQQVAMLAIELQQLKSSIPGESPEGNRQIDSLWRKTHALSLDIQRLSHQLHSSKLDHLGVVAALRGLCNEVSEQSKIEIDFQYRQVPAVIDSDISLSIFRVAQESLHNITKHAHARRVQVELLGTGGSVLLRVSDDGVGFDPDAPERKAGLGMISMRERIRAVGGAITFVSKPLLGTQVETTIPLVHESVATVSIA
jgi:PAS domain S-box-containing protein